MMLREQDFSVAQSRAVNAAGGSVDPGTVLELLDQGEDLGDGDYRPGLYFSQPLAPSRVRKVNYSPA